MERLMILSLVLALFSLFAGLPGTESRSFTIDYERDVFLKDGEPFRYISGSIDAFRIPREYWKDRFLKMKAAGLNTIQTYVAWNVHEPIEGQYDFEGQNDIFEFIEMANALDLLVILRPGPYICGEWDLGGFPAWLLKHPSIVFRSSKDKVYMNAVDKWMGVLLPKIKPLLYANGGPIITVQVENEYGSYYTCDHDYMKHLTSVFKQHLGNDVILFTTDGHTERMMRCGTLPELFATVDFGIGIDPKIPFGLLRKYQKRGPLVNSEFYPGWIDHWGEHHQTRNAAAVAKYMDMILALNASVNICMFEGGTNFGFMNGANSIGKRSQFQPVPTSYDYDAPLTESGDPTQKYYAIMEVIARYAKVPLGPVPPPTPKYAYGKVHMKKHSTFFEALSNLSKSGSVTSTYPLSMEQIDQNYGFALYHTKIPEKFLSSTQELQVPYLGDRGIVFVGKVRQATLNRKGDRTTAKLTIGEFLTLDILVENMGRVDYGPQLIDRKGIFRNVTLGGDVLGNWTMYRIDLDSVVKSPFRLSSSRKKETENTDKSKTFLSNLANESHGMPTFYEGVIPAAPGGIPKDTFLRLKGWTKGQAFINGFNLGRYWPVVGPQETLFVPSSVLSPGANSSKLVVFELDNAPCDYQSECFVEFVSTSILDGPVSPIAEPCYDVECKTTTLPNEEWTSRYTDPYSDELV